MEVVEPQRVSYQTDENVDMRSVSNMLHDNIEDSSDTEHTVKRKSRLKQLLISYSDDDEKSPVRSTTDDGKRSDEEETDDMPKQHSKSRIKPISNSDSDSDSKSDSQITQISSRIYNRKVSLKSKFDNFLKKSRETKEHMSENEIKDNTDQSASSDSDNSDSSSTIIRKKIQDMNDHLKTTLYDPDTSEDEIVRVEKPVKSKSKQKSTKMTSPKPMRMTAKQAMENMQKIKSESNRMLREKEVTLPYHRPKALSLKDIMNKRKLAVAVDGTSLPLKMNNDQLKQFEKMLVERQKEVIQLCKSDSEDETETDQNNEVNDEVNQTSVCNTEISPNISAVENLCESKENIAEIAEDAALSDSIKNPEEITDETTTLIDHNPTNSTNDNVENRSIEHIDTNIRSESDSQLIALQFDTEKLNSHEEEDIPKLPLIDNIDTLEITNDDQTEDLTCEKNYEQSLQNLSSSSEKNEVMPEAQMDVDKDDSHGEHQFSDDDLNYEDIDMLIENAEIIKESDPCVSSPALVTENNLINIKPKLTGGPGMVIDLDGNNCALPKKMSGVELLKERFTFFAKLKTPDEIERQKNKQTKPGLQFLKLKQDLEQVMAEQRSLEWSKRLEQEKQLHMEMNLEEFDENDIDKLEEKLNDDQSENDESSESEEELIENDCNMADKPRKANPMIDDEAEESDVEDCPRAETNEDGDTEPENDESENESSSESEVEEEVKPKKKRILKAFEDSDEEEEKTENDTKKPLNNDNPENDIQKDDLAAKPSQDEDIQLAQVHRSFSEDLFSTQESGNTVIEQNTEKLSSNVSLDKSLGTQSFSILHSTEDKFEINKSQHELEELKAIADDIPVGTQNASESILLKTQSFGDDVLALCTGNFYNNEFVTQAETQVDNKKTDELETQTKLPQAEEMLKLDNVTTATNDIHKSTVATEDKVENCDVLKSILNELDSPEFDTPKPKFFPASEDTGNGKEESVQTKKRFVIDSDDEDDNRETKVIIVKKKSKKKRFEQRALQISDDEDDSNEDQEEYESEIEDDEDRVVEYDSEENEVEITPQVKKKRKTTDFFEQEAELTSEDEWVGSGDEDEANLDVMEREEGDDEVFHQGKLQRELGQIHMRDVMDQDKREVRIIQELLFEDGDLGDGHRQRKFRWKNMDGTDTDDGVLAAFGESQEEDYENEAEWRKERHKREVFLRQMRKNEIEDISDLEITTTTMLKSNMTSYNEIDSISLITEKVVGKDIPSPRKPLGVFQSNYHGSLLSKGESSLARLAALAMPLNTDEDAPKTGLGKGKRNFVFSTLTQEEEDVKVTKRKADHTEDSPKVAKKLKISRQTLKNSLLDHLNP